MDNANETQASCRIGGRIKGGLRGRTIPVTEVERNGQSLSIVIYKLRRERYDLQLGEIHAVYLKSTMSPFRIVGMVFGALLAFLFLFASVYLAILLLLTVAWNYWVGRGTSIVIENSRYPAIVIPCSYAAEMEELQAVLNC